MTEQQTGQQERELDCWMTRAYEAEGKLWKAEEERDEARATKNMHKERAQQALADLDRAEARIKAVRDVHAEVEGLHCHTVCSHRSCLDDSGDQHRYPCPTIRALDA